MPAKEHDYLSKRRVIAVLNVGTVPHEDAVNGMLPKDYHLEGGFLCFPAGDYESYVVNGKEHNPDANRTAEEQRAEIRQSLIDDGFDADEADTIIESIPTINEPTEKNLTFQESRKWLAAHPEYEQKGRETLQRVLKKVEDHTSEFRQVQKRRHL